MRTARSITEVRAARPGMLAQEDCLLGLLAAVRERFYGSVEARVYYAQQRSLARALSWPAQWMNKRGVHCTQARYRSLVVDRLDAIRIHGDAANYGAYFPAYLLKCLQDWFAWHGEGLYLELKHARTAMEVVLAGLFLRDEENLGDLNTHLADQRWIESLARTHRTLAQLSAVARRRPMHTDQTELPLS